MPNKIKIELLEKKITLIVKIYKRKIVCRSKICDVNLVGVNKINFDAEKFKMLWIIRTTFL